MGRRLLVAAGVLGVAGAALSGWGCEGILGIHGVGLEPSGSGGDAGTGGQGNDAGTDAGTGGQGNDAGNEAGTPGSLDTEFGSKGVVALGKSSFDALAQMPDGRVLVGGSDPGSSSHTALAARIMPDGGMDPSFGDGGQASQPLTQFTSSWGMEAVFYIDAGIVAQVGWGEFTNGGAQIAFVDYSSNGAPASGPGGVSPILASVGGVPSQVNAAALTPDQGVVITGIKGIGLGQTQALAVVGYSDVFGTADTALRDASTPLSSVGAGTAIAVDAMNRIVVTGNGPSGPLVARLNPDCSLDASFGVQGVRQLSLSGRQPTAVAFQPDGHIVIAGPSSTPSTGYFVLRVDSSGTFDSSFDGTGVAFSATSAAQTRVSMVTLANGRIVVAPGGAPQLLRLLATGQPDPTFGPNGVGSLGAPLSSSATIAAILASSDGKIVIAGRDSGLGSGPAFIARIWN